MPIKAPLLAFSIICSFAAHPYSIIMLIPFSMICVRLILELDLPNIELSVDKKDKRENADDEKYAFAAIYKPLLLRHEGLVINEIKKWKMTSILTRIVYTWVVRTATRTTAFYKNETFTLETYFYYIFRATNYNDLAYNIMCKTKYFLSMIVTLGVNISITATVYIMVPNSMTKVFLVVESVGLVITLLSEIAYIITLSTFFQSLAWSACIGSGIMQTLAKANTTEDAANKTNLTIQYILRTTTFPDDIRQNVLYIASTIKTATGTGYVLMDMLASPSIDPCDFKKALGFDWNENIILDALDSVCDLIANPPCGAGNILTREKDTGARTFVTTGD